MLIELLTKKYPGMRLWLAQRLSAVFMASYLLLLALILVFQQPANYQAWMAFMSPWWWRVLTLMFFISLLMHAWLGVRDVFKDYVFNLTLRAVLQVVVDVLLIAYLCWVTIILWSL
ncbi:MAG: succinate dehydrogenase, hydrophobic membrane anchor protein [Methylotenera sp. 24-45-7]|jgi:succinate dehydrogenase / fumarate reductase membrane anchor subunit|nr:MAG: succinate dehydrogenase, hydrophobic membrane anchor protein [Mehylophilales bacterium 35-46-6]OYZ41664.1 MAG: succinate dehydrogenase, hydrophobic membrane anchor protein [Methylotenera sp. 24-45-7]OZA09489.1 MAG: succinate dehydrogenase, hydrophobic membrane anchor protein [Methylotenera sp. 17-45-7]OZA53215.1 MAG: succinate dehydrogenase, hydrophobic membrane anchor protein [Methylophilales bacterium 39-45-7]HQS37820.1 succinate dehydrogenase, hydrophobic membrane anchor protein [Met